MIVNHNHIGLFYHVYIEISCITYSHLPTVSTETKTSSQTVRSQRSKIIYRNTRQCRDINRKTRQCNTDIRHHMYDVTILEKVRIYSCDVLCSALWKTQPTC